MDSGGVTVKTADQVPCSPLVPGAHHGGDPAVGSRGRGVLVVPGIDQGMVVGRAQGPGVDIEDRCSRCKRGCRRLAVGAVPAVTSICPDVEAVEDEQRARSATGTIRLYPAVIRL